MGKNYKMLKRFFKIVLVFAGLLLGGVLLLIVGSPYGNSDGFKSIVSDKNLRFNFTGL